MTEGRAWVHEPNEVENGRMIPASDPGACDPDTTCIFMPRLSVEDRYGRPIHAYDLLAYRYYSEEDIAAVNEQRGYTYIVRADIVYGIALAGSARGWDIEQITTGWTAVDAAKASRLVAESYEEERRELARAARAGDLDARFHLLQQELWAERDRQWEAVDTWFKQEEARLYKAVYGLEKWEEKEAPLGDTLESSDQAPDGEHALKQWKTWFWEGVREYEGGTVDFSCIEVVGNIFEDRERLRELGIEHDLAEVLRRLQLPEPDRWRSLLVAAEEYSSEQ